MHEIFINFRVMGAKPIAYEFKRVLEERFGEDSAFLAGGSIELGSNYVETLDNKVRRSSVLLALIGPDWLDVPDPKRRGRRALNNPADWVRRELETAFECGVLVVPVLLERKTEQLDPRRLPRSLSRLAECQFERFSQRTSTTDLTRLGDRLVRRVPELAALDRRPDARKKKAQEPAGPSVNNTGQRGGIGNFQGELGTYVQDSNGPLNTGPGSQVNNPHYNGHGTSYDNQGEIRYQFGSSRREEDGDR
ncbi:toll/interleukin-1 receptor domain-containing protein [Streptomyces varsoviensis]|nr:toll/interleukin-1 receptor domain-containing protein [Streptomyces varsoviensis]